MTLVETLGARASQSRIVATDIDTEALKKARTGVYPLDQVRKIDESRVKQFFQKGTGRRSGYARVRSDVAELVEFKPLNLLDSRWPVEGPFDVIFCRNIMIYFDKKTQADILRRFAPLLKPDGLLFAGHSENFSYISPEFKLRGQTVYTLAAHSQAAPKK